MEARISDDEEEFWTFSALIVIALLFAFVTWVSTETLRQKIKRTAPRRTVERDTQTELNPVEEIMIPTNAYCSPRDLCDGVHLSVISATCSACCEKHVRLSQSLLLAFHPIWDYLAQGP